jgi:glycosyltransferase involved in cell wall biosynthesis
LASLKAEASSLGIEQNVRFLGTVADVRPCLAAADVGVLTSRSEASSNSVLEYMAVGLPVIVSDIPGNRDLVERSFFKPGDVAGLAEQMLALSGDLALRQALGAENLWRAAQYGLERFAQRASAYYAKLAVEPEGAGGYGG